MTLDFSRCRLAPFRHQAEDAERLVNSPFFFVASEMRTGKTKIVIDAAQFLFVADAIDRAIVVAPAPVRDVWYDPVLGELAKHLWDDLPSTVVEFHSRMRSWDHGPNLPYRRLNWVITNYEYLRTHADELTANSRTLLVGDESSFLKNWKSAQTRAFLSLRRQCGRVVLLNGTPIFHSPMDLFAQGNILDESILECRYVTHFRARYAVEKAVLGAGGRALTDRWGRPVKTVAGWTNLEDLQRRFAPYTVRRLQRDCLDLPPKLDPVALTATLGPATWKAYREMRDEMVVWLRSGDVAVSRTAAIKALRLSQITSGYLGGVETAGVSDHLPIGESGLPTIEDRQQFDEWITKAVCSAVEIGREKLDLLLWFIEQRLEEDPDLKLVAWHRFRAELDRTLAAVGERFPQFTVGAVHGGQRREERLKALALLKPETAPVGPVFVAGTEGTGSFGLDMCAAHTCVTVSSGYSPGRSAQTLDRLYGPNQRHPIAYFDIVAAGPRGQRTIDHAIIAARRAGADVARWTADAWVKALEE